MKVLIRPAEATDRAFLIATWLNNYRRESYFAARICDAVFFSRHHEIVDELLRRSTVSVACDPQDKDCILGYMVWEPDALHWIYVKKSFRKLGIARELFRHSKLPEDLDGVQVTHATKMWFTTRERGPGLEDRFKKAVYNPYRGVIL